MTKAQKTALFFHCRLAAECANVNRFRHRLPGLGTLILTVNSGYE
jgi:hypothetical protein